MTLQIDNEGWEACAHRHTPVGTLPEINKADHWQWTAATIPFDAIAWLNKNNHAPDPLVGFNDILYRWAEDVDWVLRKRFAGPAEAFHPDDDLQFVINRVDCYFELFLNGQHIGKGRNQFHDHSFDLDEIELLDENELIIYIRSARNVNSVLETAYGQLPAGFDTGRVHARRSQCLTGWDWTPRLSSVSVLEPPVIRKNFPLQITGLNAYVLSLPPVIPGQENAESVQVQITADLVSRRRASGELLIQIIDLTTGEVVGEKTESVTIKPKTVQMRRTIELINARLWWSLGMGGQPLYRVDIKLSANDRVNFEYELSADTTFGVRTITIDRHKDELGETFVPLVNGVAVFCRGANWVPVNMLPSKASEGDYRTLLAAAVGVGMNCIRVWGGGIYETDLFYQLCDEAGILVWQDFMFACAAYPTYRQFLEEVEAEVLYQVIRLRNHPCIMLWCGNNENEWLHQAGGLKKGSEQKIIGETIWSNLIREIVEDYDPSRAYHQSSPFGKNKADYNDQLSGDRHNWDAWSDWQHADNYMLDLGRFISEFGFQSLPDMESIKTFAPSADSLDHPELCHHQKMIEGQQRLVRYVAAHYKMPATLDEWVSTTQQLQAEILRRAVEHWRRRRMLTSGVLVWQLHDAYPGISWSMIDFYRRPKASWTAARSFFAPVLLTMELSIGGVESSVVPTELWTSNQPDQVSEFPVEGGERIICRQGAPLVQTTFFIINDTWLPLTGELKVQFLRSENDIVILDSISLQVEPNSTLTALTHEIGPKMMIEITALTVRAEFIPDEKSTKALESLTESIRKIQSQLLTEESSENGNPWQFSANEGLSLTSHFVDPKYYRGNVDSGLKTDREF